MIIIINGVRTHDLRDTGATLNRLSHEALLESRSGASSIYTRYIYELIQFSFNSLCSVFLYHTSLL